MANNLSGHFIRAETLQLIAECIEALHISTLMELDWIQEHRWNI